MYFNRPEVKEERSICLIFIYLKTILNLLPSPKFELLLQHIHNIFHLIFKLIIIIFMHFIFKYLILILKFLKISNEINIILVLLTMKYHVLYYYPLLVNNCALQLLYILCQKRIHSSIF